MQTVFKVDLLKNAGLDGGRPFIPRRVHKKSRVGCLACKKRRLKCDEKKPQCTKCTKTNDDCVYPRQSAVSPKTLFVDERCESPKSDLYSMSVDVLETDLDDMLRLTSNLAISNDAASPLRLLQHFQTVTSLTLGGSVHKTIMHGFVGQEAISFPYLMHIVLAVSAAHLKRLAKDAAQLKMYQRCAVAEAAHWQSGLQLYRDALNSDEKPDFDATLASTFMSIIFVFALDDNIPVDAFAGDDEEKFLHAINPLAATNGFRALQLVFGPFMASSVWKIVLRTSDDDDGTFSNPCHPGIEGLPAAFVDLCELDESSNSNNNEYYFIVRLLTPLLKLEPNLEHFSKFIAFSGRTWAHFRPLIHRKDPRGLLLVSYWFALLYRLDQWWLTLRAKTECTAIVTYLSQLRDAKITSLLAYPSSFGQADLSYIWDPPSEDSNSASIFERYFRGSLR